ncbi:major vault protein [Homo sapiens]|uniref:Major vault protein n=5 Tax=Simiiformes TaxID=314293 RepID=H3BUP3_HUMAN|nr:major vault protein [Homo sapiens]KAI4054404.1 major vault protein [Homo sapiens]
MATEEFIIRIPPYHYIHVLDQNSNVSRVEVGPKTYIRQDNERTSHPCRWFCPTLPSI